MILKQYAPVTAQYGFHFKAFSHNIFTPVIRQEVRGQRIREKEHYTVYLPAYDDERLIKKLLKFKHVEWQVFSKHNQKPIAHKNITIEPISNLAFINSMASSQGVLCGAGFETPAEALFMKKKLLVVPMKNQYEQQLNAAALKSMGVPVIKSLKSKHESTIQQWLDHGKVVEVNYPDQTREILDLIIQEHLR
jgi:uncharacterized protein (TIGR00661 family)